MSSQQAASGPSPAPPEPEHKEHNHAPLVAIASVEVEETKSWQRVVSVKLPAAEWQAARAHVLTGVRRKAQVPGFRKGKVPPAMVESLYAREIVMDALDWLLPRAWHQALHEVTLNTVSEPDYSDIDLGEESGEFSFKATVEVRPEVKIEGYRGQSVTAYEEEVPADGVERTLAQLQEARAEFGAVERAAAEGDRVTVDFRQVDEGGLAVLGTEVKDHVFELGSPYVLEAFSTGVRGMAPAEERRFPVTYPADYDQESLAGQTRNFQVTLKGVEAKSLPALDDGFASEVGKFESLQQLRDQVGANIEAEIRDRNRGRLEAALVRGLLEKNPFELPPSMVASYVAHLISDQERRGGRALAQDERQQAVEGLAPGAELAIKRWFILDAVAKQEALAVSEADYEGHLDALAAAEGRPAAEIRKSVERAGAAGRLREDLLHRKVFAFLAEQAQIQRAPIPRPEAEA